MFAEFSAFGHIRFLASQTRTNPQGGGWHYGPSTSSERQQWFPPSPVNRNPIKHLVLSGVEKEIYTGNARNRKPRSKESNLKIIRFPWQPDSNSQPEPRGAKNKQTTFFSKALGFESSVDSGDIGGNWCPNPHTPNQILPVSFLMTSQKKSLLIPRM